MAASGRVRQWCLASAALLLSPKSETGHNREVDMSHLFTAIRAAAIMLIALIPLATPSYA
jgi:hypothetical protein